MEELNRLISSKVKLANFVKKCLDAEIGTEGAENKLCKEYGIKQDESFLIYGGDMVRTKDVHYVPIYRYTAKKFVEFVSRGNYSLVSTMSGIGYRKNGLTPHKIIEIETEGKKVVDKVLNAIEKIENVTFEKQKSERIKKGDRFTPKGYFKKNKRYANNNCLPIIRDDYDNTPILYIIKRKNYYYFSDKNGSVSFLKNCKDVRAAVVNYLNWLYPDGLEDFDAHGVIDGVPYLISSWITIENIPGKKGKRMRYEKRY